MGRQPTTGESPDAAWFIRWRTKIRRALGAHWSTVRRNGRDILITIASLVSMAVLYVVASHRDVLDLQFGRACEVFRASWVPMHLFVDYAFMVAYVAAASIFLKYRWPHRAGGRGLQPSAFVPWLPGLLGLVDFAENGAIWFARSACPTDGTLSRAAVRSGNAVYALASAKWLLVAIVVLLVLWSIPRRPPAPATKKGELRKDPGGVGICCSGGGIRSASFALGALHGMDKDTVRSARYLAAVSGGAYTATAMTVHAASPSKTDELPFGPGSKELRHLRAKVGYLGLNAADARVSVARAVASIALNLLMLYLVVFAVARPVGWLIQGDVVHPELQASTPLLYDPDLETKASTPMLSEHPTVAVTRALDAARTPPCEDGADAAYWDIRVDAFYELTWRQRTSRTDVTPEDRSSAVFQVPGQLRSCNGSAEITLQPRLLMPPAVPAVNGHPPFAFDTQPEVTLAASTIRSPASNQAVDIAALVDLTTEPRVESVAVTMFGPKIMIDGWMWGITVAGLLLAAVTIAADWSALDGRAGGTLRLPRTTAILALVGAGGGLLFVVLPWLVQEVPTWLAHLPDLIPGGGAAANQTVSPLQWIATAFGAGTLGRFAVSRIASGVSRLGRGILLLLQLGAFLLLALTGALMIIGVMSQGALNGPIGTGSWNAASDLPWRFATPDLARWMTVVGVLLVARTIPAQVWSFGPLYRDRLAEAFGIRQSGRLFSEYQRGAVEHLTDVPRHPNVGTIRGWPELVICCAVNLNDVDRTEIPAKRWADSFTFSASSVGSPTIGYHPTPSYLDRLSTRRVRELTLATLVATSGAAVTSAMGKKALGAVGGLLAALNVRLGAWIPNPRTVDAVAKPASFTWTPGWPHVLREIFGRYRADAPFLYVTDGGHWENLGLTELVRRGCKEIYVISAAGDGSDSFATLGEALAMTREQTEIEIVIDPSPLRRSLGAAASSGGRQLVRTEKGTTQIEGMAAKPYVVGWWEHATKGRGAVLFVEANLTPSMPWDVHAYAERNSIFPNDPTSNQFFSAETFEAYRRLGEYQMSVAAASPEWAAAGEFVAGT
jgi:hypothetical protein